MKRWIQHFYQLNRLNWLMVWLLLCCSIILLFPAGLMTGAVSQWATVHAAWLGVGMLIAISYFCSQGFLIAWEWACEEWQSRRQQDQLAQMIGFLDFKPCHGQAMGELIRADGGIDQCAQPGLGKLHDVPCWVLTN